ncbi:MAG: glycosyltransferase family 2 protein [Opitutaceae bacterium]|nr:glycosyltransferase family 2 protein [Opitutaceae bacterium]
MSDAARTHLVLVPSYNSGRLLLETVRAALAQWRPVWVVIDGSVDGSERAVLELARTEAHLRVIIRPRNGGKGAAVLTGAQAALAAGFTHALVMDADGQHPADRIAAFMRASLESPRALVLGRPVFGPEAPLVRLQGRKLSVGLVRWEILGPGIDDPLFGFRVYPLMALVAAMLRTRGARHYDFDPEMAVRLVWAGVPTINLPAACRYRAAEEGGISHFHYVRDNVRMVWLHARLLVQLLWRWPDARRAQVARRVSGVR